MVNFLKVGILFLAFFTVEANAAFVGDYDFDNWNSTNKITLIDTDSVQLVSSNAPNLAPKARNQDFTFESIGKGIVSFDWTYTTADKRSPKFDPFGWLLNGTFTALTTDLGPKSQSGSFSFNVNVGDIFGFRIHSTDSQKGAATAVVSNFSGPAPVPAPAALWLMLAPVMTLFRKRQKA